MREDALQVYLRHRDNLYTAILKSSDYDEEAEEYSESAVNLIRHDIAFPRTRFDAICLGAILKAEKTERRKRKERVFVDRDKRGKGKLLTRFATGHTGRHMFQRNTSIMDTLRALKLDSLQHITDHRVWDDLDELAGERGFLDEAGNPDFDKVPEKTEEEKAAKNEMLQSILEEHMAGEVRPAGTHYLPVNKQEHIHSEWPSVDPDAGINDNYHYWHESVHPLRKKNSKTGRSQMSELLRNYVWRTEDSDPFDGEWNSDAESMAEKHAKAIAKHENDNSTHQIIRGMDKTLAKTKDAFANDHFTQWRIANGYPIQHHSDAADEKTRKEEIAQMDEVVRNEYRRDVEADPKGDHNNEDGLSFDAWLRREYEESREAKSSFLGSVLGGTMGAHSMDLLYERAFRNWLEENPEKKNLPERLQRQEHMKQAQENWDSPDAHQSDALSIDDATMDEQGLIEEAVENIDPRLSIGDLPPEKQHEIMSKVYQKTRGGAEGRKHAHQLGHMGYMLGLEWLEPRDRTRVIDHIMEHGTDTHGKQEITLGDGTKIPMGLIKRNFLMRFTPEYNHTQRRGSSTGPNRGKHVESDADTSGERLYERGSVWNAVQSVLGEGGSELHTFLSQMAGHAPGSKATMPIVGLKEPKRFKAKVREFTEGTHADLLNDDGTAGEPHDNPVHAAMQDQYDGVLNNNKTPEEELNWKDFLRLVGWRQDKNGEFHQVESHEFFDDWSEDHPSNISKEQMERIAESRESFLGFSKIEKEIRNLFGFIKCANGIDEDPDGHYVEDDMGMKRGLSDFFSRLYEHGGDPMTSHHLLEALATTFAPRENNYTQRFNPKTRKYEDVPVTDVKGAFDGLLGKIHATGQMMPKGSMMGLLAHFIPEVLSPYVTSPSVQSGALVNMLSPSDSSTPDSPKNPGKFKARNNKNNTRDHDSAILHGLNNARDAMSVEEHRDAIEHSRNAQGFLISQTVGERNSKFTDNHSTALGVKNDPSFSDKKIREQTHEYVRRGTSMGVKHRPGMRWSQDSEGIWREDPNGELKLGSPYSNLSTKEMLKLDADHRMAYADSDADFLNIIDDTGLTSLIDELTETPRESRIKRGSGNQLDDLSGGLPETLPEEEYQTPLTDLESPMTSGMSASGENIGSARGLRNLISNPTESGFGSLTVTAPSNRWGIRNLGELRRVIEIERMESNLPEGDLAELKSLETDMISGFIRDKTKKGHAHESLEANQYDMTRKSMDEAVMRLASVLKDRFLELDPDAFDPSNPAKFIANHAQLMHDAELMTMHLSHEDIAMMMPDGKGLHVTAPDVGTQTVMGSVEGHHGESVHLPIAQLLGMGSDSFIGTEVSNEHTPKEICKLLGLDWDDPIDKEVVKRLHGSLPEYKEGEEPAIRRVASIGDLLQVDSQISKLHGEAWHGLERRGVRTEREQKKLEMLASRIQEVAESGDLEELARLQVQYHRMQTQGNTYGRGHDWDSHETTEESLDGAYDDYGERFRAEHPEPSVRYGGQVLPVSQDMKGKSSFVNDFVRNHPVFTSIAGLMRMFQNPKRHGSEDLANFGLSHHFADEGNKKLKQPHLGGSKPFVEQARRRLKNLVSYDPQIIAPNMAMDSRQVPLVSTTTTQLHPGRHGRVMGGASMLSHYTSPTMRREGALMLPSVSANVGATGMQLGTETTEQHLVFPAHDTYAEVHGDDVTSELQTSLEDPNTVLPWSDSQSPTQRVTETQPMSMVDTMGPDIVSTSRPTTISGLLLKELPKEMPLIEPMHKIFDIEDLNQLRGFTGEWVVSVFYEGERIKVKRRKNSLTITDIEHEKFALSDEMNKSLRKLCKHNFTIDAVLNSGTLYVSDIMHYDGNDVTDMSTRERVKVLRGQFDSHENVIIPSPSTLKITDEEGLKSAVKGLLDENKDAKLLLRDAKSTYMKGEEKHPKWILMTKSDDDFHIPFGMELDEGHFILHFSDDLVKYDIIDDSPQNPIAAIAGFSDSDYPIRLAKSLEKYWRPAFGEMLKESTPLQEPMTPNDTEEESAGIIKPNDEDRIKKPKKYLEALLRLEKRIDDFEKGHYPMSGSKGMYFDVDSPRGPTELVHPSALPDYDMVEPEGQELEQEEDYPGKRKKAAETAHKDEELETFGNL